MSRRERIEKMIEGTIYPDGAVPIQDVHVMVAELRALWKIKDAATKVDNALGSGGLNALSIALDAYEENQDG